MEASIFAGAKTLLTQVPRKVAETSLLIALATLVGYYSIKAFKSSYNSLYGNQQDETVEDTPEENLNFIALGNPNLLGENIDLSRCITIKIN